MIESLNNEKVKYWTKLSSKKYQNETGLFIVEGLHPVEEALKANLLKEIILTEEVNIDFNDKTYVTEDIMRKITSLTNPPKIIGIVKMIEPKPLCGNVLLLDRISDPGNLGTIIRSACAFGINTIILGENSVSLYNPKVLRATEGLIFHMNVLEGNLLEFIPLLKQDGYKIYSTDVEKGSELKNISFADKNAIIMGNEGAGVSDDIRKEADEYLYIKMDSTCESLNVGVATSIILYELFK